MCTKDGMLRRRDFGDKRDVNQEEQIPQADPEMRRQSLEALERGEYVTAQHMIIDCQERLINKLTAENRRLRKLLLDTETKAGVSPVAERPG